MLNDTSGAAIQPGYRADKKRGRLVERGMTRIDHPIELAAAPANAELDAHVEGMRDATKERDRELLHPAMLDPRDAGSRGSRGFRKVELPPTPVDANCPEPPSDLDVVHENDREPRRSSRTYAMPVYIREMQQAAPNGIVATLLHELARRNGRYGLATLCLGGGGSVAMAFERVA